jgi:hypothetical protein
VDDLDGDGRITYAEIASFLDRANQTSGSAANDTVAIGGKKLQFAMPAAGWATVKFK